MEGIDFTTILFGQAGIAVILAVIVGWVKKQWPDAKKMIYMIIAIIGSLGAGAIAFVVYSIAWDWLLWIGLAGATLGFQLLEQNEAWPKVKEVLLLVLEALRTRKKKE